jgi:steroid delta-isomerase-like uncharacterized protein
MSQQEQNKALVRRRFEEVWHQANDAAIDELVDEKYMSNGQQIGRAGYRQFVQGMRHAFPDIHFTIEEMVAENDLVALRYISQATQQRDFMGIPATNKQVTVRGMDIFRIRNGQIAEAWSIFDQLAMLQQLGVVKLPGQ